MKDNVSENKRSVTGGFHPVDELISKNGFLPGDELLVSRTPGKRIQEILYKAKKAGVNVVSVSGERLAQLLGSEHHQGIVLIRSAEIKIPELTEEVILKGGIFVVLESVQDPGNLGVIARSIAAFGANGLILSKHESAPIGQSAMKSSAGSLVNVPVMHTGRIASFLQGWVDNFDVCIVGTSLAGEVLTPAKVADLKTRHKIIFLVFGSEQSGLSRLAGERCHVLLKIPQTSTVQSINVAQAATIFLYEFCTRNK
ncbi:MAG: RNA methyltransferase [Spirochaetia bacterium]|nr:RNA methyltransferase [Spirochaetia bacterium]